MLSDLDTAQSSSKFLKDDFLRLLPITRMDIDHVSLRFKIGVGGVSINKNESQFLFELVEKIKSYIIDVLKNKKYGKIPSKTIEKIILEETIKIIVPEISNIEPSKPDIFTRNISKPFSRNLIDRIKTIFPELILEQFETKLESFFNEILSLYLQTYEENFSSQLLKEIGRLDVIVESQQLRELPPEALVEMQIQLIPKTFHWSLKPEHIDNKEASPEDKYTLMPGG